MSHDVPGHPGKSREKQGYNLGYFAFPRQRYPTLALTALRFRQALPREKPYKLFDGGGLFLLVKPNGCKFWREAVYGDKRRLARPKKPRTKRGFWVEVAVGIEPLAKSGLGHQ